MPQNHLSEVPALLLLDDKAVCHFISLMQGSLKITQLLMSCCVYVRVCVLCRLRSKI